MLGQKLGHIVSFAVHNHPAVFVIIVLGNLCAVELATLAIAALGLRVVAHCKAKMKGVIDYSGGGLMKDVDVSQTWRPAVS